MNISDIFISQINSIYKGNTICDIFLKHKNEIGAFNPVPFFSCVGDGSTDVSTKEEDVIGSRYTWKGIPRNEFVGIFELDLEKSKDRKSPDAMCLEGSYDRAFNSVFHGPTCSKQLDKARDKDGPGD